MKVTLEQSMLTSAVAVELLSIALPRFVWGEGAGVRGSVAVSQKYLHRTYTPMRGGTRFETVRQDHQKRDRRAAFRDLDGQSEDSEQSLRRPSHRRLSRRLPTTRHEPKRAAESEPLPPAIFEGPSRAVPWAEADIHRSGEVVRIEAVFWNFDTDEGVVHTGRSANAPIRIRQSAVTALRSEIPVSTHRRPLPSRP